MNKESRECKGYGVFADFYERLMGDVDYEALAEYYDGLLRDTKGAEPASAERANAGRASASPTGILLDLACGTGALSVLMAQRGWDVIAVDVSLAMLSKAKPHPNVTYICQDMVELDLYGTIDAAVCTFDGLNHLPSKAALSRTLERVRLFMNPGGVFAFDINTLYKHETTLGNNTFVKQTDDLYCVWQNASQGRGVVDITLEIFEQASDGYYDRFTEEIRQMAHPLEVVGDLCRKCGFEVIGCYEFMSHSPGGENNDKVVIVCKKSV